MAGADAFEKLKRLAAKASVSKPPKALQLPHEPLATPELEKKRLLVEAREGLPVKGVKATWEAGRPVVVAESTAKKVGRLNGVPACMHHGWECCMPRCSNEFMPKHT